MDLVKRLAAFCSSIEGTGGIALWKPWELDDLWVQLGGIETDEQLLELLSDPQRDLYQAWIKKEVES